MAPILEQTEEQRKAAFAAAGIPLPKTKAPTSVTDVSGGVTEPTLPSTTVTQPDTADAASKVAASKTKTDSLIAEREKAIADEQARREATLKAEAEREKGLLSTFFGDRESREDLTTEFEQKYGADSAAFLQERKAKEAEYDTIYNEFLSAKAAVEQAQAGLESQGRGIPLDLLSNQKAQIAKNAAPKLNALAAQANMVAAQLERINGNYADAQNLVNKAVQNAVADQKDELDQYLAFREIESDTFDAVEDTYRDAYDERVRVLEEEYNQAVKDRTYAANAQLEFSKAGILLSDTPEEVNAKIAAAGGRTTGQIIGSAEEGYVNVIRDAQGNIVSKETVREGTGGTTTGSNEALYTGYIQLALDNGATPEEAVRAAVNIANNDKVKVSVEGLTQIAKGLSPNVAVSEPEESDSFKLLAPESIVGRTGSALKRRKPEEGVLGLAARATYSGVNDFFSNLFGE